METKKILTKKITVKLGKCAYKHEEPFTIDLILKST